MRRGEVAVDEQRLARGVGDARGLELVVVALLQVRLAGGRRRACRRSRPSRGRGSRARRSSGRSRPRRPSTPRRRACRRAAGWWCTGRPRPSAPTRAACPRRARCRPRSRRRRPRPGPCRWWCGRRAARPSGWPPRCRRCPSPFGRHPSQSERRRRARPWPCPPDPTPHARPPWPSPPPPSRRPGRRSRSCSPPRAGRASRPPSPGRPASRGRSRCQVPNSDFTSKPSRKPSPFAVGASVCFGPFSRAGGATSAAFKVGAASKPAARARSPPGAVVPMATAPARIQLCDRPDRLHCLSSFAR